MRRLLNAMPSININIDQAIFNPKFYPLLFDEHRFLLLKGGTGSGKSWFAAQKIVHRFLTESDHRFLVMRKVASSIKDSCWELILATIMIWGIAGHCSINKSDFTITNNLNNSKIIFKGLDKVEKQKSIERITGIWIEEGTELTKQDFVQLNIRMRGLTKYYKQIIISFNPINIHHWIKTLFFDPENPNRFSSRARNHHSTYRHNKWLTAEDRDNIESNIDIDVQFHRIYALGLWGVLQGLIYDINHQIIDKFPTEFDRVVYGWDFGYNDPQALIKIGCFPDRKEAYISQLFYGSNTLTDELVPRFPEFGIEKHDPIYCDSSRPEDIERVKRMGYKALPSKKGAGSVYSGIVFLKGWKLFTLSRDVDINNEFQVYKWKEDRAGNILEEPVDDHNHAMDGIRYPLWTAFGIPPTETKIWMLGE